VAGHLGGRVDAQAAATAELARRVSVLTGQARNADGSIAVTVAASGQLQDLELTDDVHLLSGRKLAETILTVMRAAQRQLTDQVAAQVDSTIGGDTETGRAVLAGFERRFPPAVEDTDER
jgi:hypothetical protein